MRTVCLVLDKRLDYYEKYIRPEFKKRLNLDVELFLVGDGQTTAQPYNYIDEDLLPIRFEKSTKYPTWFKTPNAYNAWRSHNHIFTKVLNSNDDYFLLLEDDVFIEDDFEQILGDNLDEAVKTTPIDLLYLGSYNSSKTGRLESPNLLSLPRLSGVGGFHAVIISRKVIKRLLELPPFGPYDWMTSQYIHGELYRCLAVNPSIITQKDGFSYVEQRYLNKPDRSV